MQRFAPEWPKDKLSDLVFWVAMGVIVGGRLGYVLFYDLAAYINQPSLILQVWKGGMSFHGGFLGVVLAMALFARARALNLLSLLDIGAVVAPIVRASAETGVGYFADEAGFDRVVDDLHELFGRATTDHQQPFRGCGGGDFLDKAVPAAAGIALARPFFVACTTRLTHIDERLFRGRHNSVTLEP